MGLPFGTRFPGGEPAYLGLGSNLGDRLQALREGLRILEDSGVGVLRLSSVYDTDPVGDLEQDAFLNLVAEVSWPGGAEDLLRCCLQAERQLKRERLRKNGPRTLDVDILLWGRLVYRKEELEIPHPRLHERRFVLVPLEELAPQALHPVRLITVRELLARCPDRSGVRKVAAGSPLNRTTSPAIIRPLPGTKTP